MKRLTFVFVVALLGGALLFGQPLQDPWWRPLNPSGGSQGITYGQTAPMERGLLLLQSLSGSVLSRRL